MGFDLFALELKSLGRRNQELQQQNAGLRAGLSRLMQALGSDMPQEVS